jgi:hypothetical protein
MEDFEWAQNNLGVQTPHELQARGVNVYFAPNIRPCIKLVNLGTGQVNWFQEDEARPKTGYWLGFDDLDKFCREHGLPLAETNGLVSVLSYGKGAAGDPIRTGTE